MRKIINIFVMFSLSLFLAAQILLAQDLSLAPNFDLQDTANTKVSLNSYKGKQQLLLFFWTTWCPFCRKELKGLNSRYQELLKNGWDVLAIDVGEPAEKITNFLKSQKMTLGFKMLLDKSGLLTEEYDVFGVHTYIFIDKIWKMISQAHSLPANYKRLFFK